MKETFINAVIKHLIDEGYVPLTSTLDERTIIKSTLKQFENSEFAVWTTSDVMDRAKEIGKKITKKQAKEILTKVFHNFDASYGVNWAIFDDYIIDIS